MSNQLEAPQAATDAADTILRAAEMFRGFVSAAQILKEFGTFEHAVEEMRNSVAAATNERNKTLDALNKAVTDMDVVRDEAAAIVQRAHAAAAQISAAANKTAESIYDKANADAEKIKADAEKIATQTTNAANAEIAKLHAQKKAIEDNIPDIKARADKVKAEALAAEQRLAKVKEQIAVLART